jgi:hypothetical protein
VSVIIKQEQEFHLDNAAAASLLQETKQPHHKPYNCLFLNTRGEASTVENAQHGKLQRAVKAPDGDLPEHPE